MSLLVAVFVAIALGEASAAAAVWSVVRRESSVWKFVTCDLTLDCWVCRFVSGTDACAISAFTMVVKSMLLKPLKVMGEDT